MLEQRQPVATGVIALGIAVGQRPEPRAEPAARMNAFIIDRRHRGYTATAAPGHSGLERVEVLEVVLEVLRHQVEDEAVDALDDAVLPAVVLTTTLASASSFSLPPSNPERPMTGMWRDPRAPPP